MNQQKSLNGPVEKSQAVRDQVIERLRKGEVVYERDMAALAHELELMSRLHQPLEAGQLFTAMGLVELHRGHFVAAYDYAMSALPYFTQSDDKRLVISTLHSLGDVSRRWGKYDEAQAYFSKAGDLATTLQDHALLARVLSSTGWLKLNTEGGEQAQASLSEALHLVDQLQPSTLADDIKAEILIGLSLAQLDLQKFSKAWEYAQQALEISARHAHTCNLGVAYRTLGAIAYQAHANEEMQLEQPQGYFGRAKDLFRLSGARAELAHTLIIEGDWLVTRGHIKGARDSYAEAEQLFGQVKLYDEALEIRRRREST